MQYDFAIECKKGKENKVACALSRLPIAELAAMTLSIVRTDLLTLIMQSYKLDGELLKLIQLLKRNAESNTRGILFYT